MRKNKKTVPKEPEEPKAGCCLISLFEQKATRADVELVLRRINQLEQKINVISEANCLQRRSDGRPIQPTQRCSPSPLKADKRIGIVIDKCSRKTSITGIKKKKKRPTLLERCFSNQSRGSASSRTCENDKVKPMRKSSNTECVVEPECPKESITELPCGCLVKKRKCKDTVAAQPPRITLSRETSLCMPTHACKGVGICKHCTEQAKCYTGPQIPNEPDAPSPRKRTESCHSIKEKPIQSGDIACEGDCGRLGKECDQPPPCGSPSGNKYKPSFAQTNEHEFPEPSAYDSKDQLPRIRDSVRYSEKPKEVVAATVQCEEILRKSDTHQCTMTSPMGSHSSCYSNESTIKCPPQPMANSPWTKRRYRRKRGLNQCNPIPYKMSIGELSRISVTNPESIRSPSSRNCIHVHVVPSMDGSEQRKPPFYMNEPKVSVIESGMPSQTSSESECSNVCSTHRSPRRRQYWHWYDKPQQKPSFKRSSIRLKQCPDTPVRVEQCPNTSKGKLELDVRSSDEPILELRKKRQRRTHSQKKCRNIQYYAPRPHCREYCCVEEVPSNWYLSETQTSSQLSTVDANPPCTIVKARSPEGLGKEKKVRINEPL